MDKDTTIRYISQYLETESYSLVIDEFGKPILTIEAWEKITKILLLLKLPYDDQVSEMPGIEMVRGDSPLTEIDPNRIGILINDIYEITFLSLYPNIIIAMNIDDQPNFEIFKFIVRNRAEFKKNMSSNGFYVVKAWINFYYGILSKRNKELGKMITGTAKSIMTKVQTALGRDVIYSHVDTIFFMGKEKLDNIIGYANYVGFPYEIEHYESGIFFAKQKYVLFKKLEDVRMKGFKKINFGN